MQICSECGERIYERTDRCPFCSLELPNVSDRRQSPVKEVPSVDREAGRDNFDEQPENEAMKSVARFRNAAEAGFFAHELTHVAGIPAAVTVQENFDAISGNWSSGYLLTVPIEMAETAAKRLQQMVEQSDTDEEFDAGMGDWHSRTPAESDCFTVAQDNQATVHWIPIVLTLAAGSIVFWGVRKLQERPNVNAQAVSVGRPQDDIWGEISRSSHPWIQRHENGHGHRLFEIEPDRRHALIYEDSDGDGVFETKTRFTIPR